MFVGRYDRKGEIFLVVNKLKGRGLNMGESQHEGFRKAGAGVVENNDDDDKGRGDI